MKYFFSFLHKIFPNIQLTIRHSESCFQNILPKISNKSPKNLKKTPYHFTMAFQVNHQMSIYIPIVQKWTASEEYVKNAFRHAFMGEVVRVDFVARNGGAPELARELSAFVYLDWANNTHAENWQKVILAKSPINPPHLYHTLGPNYWILNQNMKPRTAKQVVESRLWVLTSQTQKIEELERDNFKMKLEIAKLKAGTPITMNAPYQTDAEKIQELEQKLKTSGEMVVKLMSDLAQSEGINQVRYRSIIGLRTMIRSTDETIISLEQQLKTSDQKVVNLLTNVAQAEASYNIAKGKIAAASVKYENLEKEQVQILVRKNKKIKELQSSLERVEERGTEDDFVLIQKLQEKISELATVSANHEKLEKEYVQDLASQERENQGIAKQT